MKLDNLKTIEQMASFINGAQAIAFAVASNKNERYHFVEGILQRFGYQKLRRCDKGIVIQFLIKVTSYSRQQLTRMIQRYVAMGRLTPRSSTKDRPMN